jgi:hypothetical protein
VRHFDALRRISLSLIDWLEAGEAAHSCIPWSREEQAVIEEQPARSSSVCGMSGRRGAIPGLSLLGTARGGSSLIFAAA